MFRNLESSLKIVNNGFRVRYEIEFRALNPLLRPGVEKMLNQVIVVATEQAEMLEGLVYKFPPAQAEGVISDE